MTHGIKKLLGLDVARAYMNAYNQLCPSVCNLCALVNWLLDVLPHIEEEQKPCVEARRVENVSKKNFDAHSFAWITQKRGVWIVSTFNWITALL